MLRLPRLSAPSSIHATRQSTSHASARRVQCRAWGDPSLAEKALASPNDQMRQWGLTELVRKRPEDGLQDAMRCQVLTRFAREHGARDQHVLLDIVQAHGVSPRMLPVFNELMASNAYSVRERALPLYSALVGLYNVTSHVRDSLAEPQDGG